MDYTYQALDLIRHSRYQTHNLTFPINPNKINSNGAN